jgi:hypothetical protein
MNSELLLLSGNDIPFSGARIAIHQPTLKEIAYVGEESFYLGCEFLKFSKDKLQEEDRVKLENQTDFDILISILNTKDISKQQICIEMVLSLIFPNYTIKFGKNYISLKDDKEEYKIDNSNFNQFKNILDEIFCLKAEGEEVNLDYNPEGSLAKRIADKLNKGRQKINELKNNGQQKVAILSRYISILAVGENKDINNLMNYTVYQINDEYKRFRLKEDYDMYIKAKLAGAQDLKEPEH